MLKKLEIRLEGGKLAETDQILSCIFPHNCAVRFADHLKLFLISEESREEQHPPSHGCRNNNDDRGRP